MRPFLRRLTARASRCPWHRRPPRGLDCARAVLFEGDLAGEIRKEALRVSRAPGQGAGSVALAAAAARY